MSYGHMDMELQEANPTKWTTVAQIKIRPAFCRQAVLPNRTLYSFGVKFPDRCKNEIAQLPYTKNLFCRVLNNKGFLSNTTQYQDDFNLCAMSDKN